ncbi:hypothetical protein KO488_12325 [Poseidonibacter lekithochrous]|uniref:hypothetical protein n=1 Tax=Poseidonibacter TaxID=2321187 RepID=UPI001C091743|nr:MULTISPECIES: hypothetical protein [Poseidonibacter]MBU3015546.1 hypothetical protein [Poseidonibacter lekithochrous]MDO6828845.1 hypothetical protein [Poseidonibacter sp. 1_MG-2023]
MKLQKILAMLAIAGAVSLFAEGTASQSNKTIDLKEKGLQEKKLEKKVKEDVKKVKDVIKTKTK